jgi:hypothetical protein
MDESKIRQAFGLTTSKVVPAVLVGPIMTLLYDDRVPGALRDAFAEAVIELDRQK